MNRVDPDNLKNAATGQYNRAAILPYNPGPAAISAEANFFQAAFPMIFTPLGPTSATPNNAVTTAGNQALVYTLGRTLHAIQVSGTFVATILVEASLDAQLTQWTQLDQFTAASIKQYSGIFYALRFSISAYTSGSPLVTYVMQR